MGIMWKVMYPKGVLTLIMPREIAVPLLKRIIYWPTVNWLIWIKVLSC